MLGYVIVNKNELSEEEYEVYNGYYCAVCKSIGRRFGQFPRLALSYDIVFLALLLSSLTDDEIEIADEHCIIHPIKKKPVVKSDLAIDYAADMLLILAYHNFLDDKQDEHKIRGTLGSTLLASAYSELKITYPKLCNKVEDGIKKLSYLESNKSDSIDETGMAFGEILASVFAEGSDIDATDRERILYSLGLNLGRWIYLMDALDDLDRDQKNGSYNPLIYRKGGKEGLNNLAYNYLGDVANAIDLLDIKKNKGIIENVIWNGLRARSEVLLDIQEGNDDGSI